MTNREALEKANRAFCNGDYEELLTYCTEDTKWTFVGDRTLAGKNDVREYLTSTEEGSTFRIEKYVEDGDELIAIGKIELIKKDGGITISPVCDVWKFRNGKMAQLIRSFFEYK